ncbi:MAG: ABC transporter ATP-binding protein [Candidatus Pristimantibacillus lignocellulolyticus]|uniref:ABC transporter ATP-binding protein n=1 Tax=Candidatus Pristimantibacillus lignocellulolyticus TaxID=2994561 RepID=A0A9J6ZHM8_9BACL|nr:MAG: ABC transporter ATP-binding protein [Candidatus Pristimantibacillus lignocellulolyticus]
MTYIKVKNVSKFFERRGQVTEALRDINLEFEQGTFVSLIGPSGCGKSTLLRIVGGLADVDQGEVTIGGMTTLGAQSQKQFGFVPQSPALFPWRTVLENMNVPFEVNIKGVGIQVEDREDPIKLLQSVGLGDFVNSYAKELSGGMQQRVGIARAFGSGAPILLMDEPFSALDEITREMISYQLLHIWEAHQKTVLFVTHSLREAVLLSDKVVVMSARPGQVSKVIDINLPRPRQASIEDTEEFHQYVTEIRGYLRDRWK